MAKGHGERLTRKMEDSIAALLTEKTVEDAARKANVGYRTLKGWMARSQPFREAYRLARQEVLERTVARLLALTDKAAEALERNLTCGKPAGEVRAAALVFANAIKGMEILDLAEEVEQLRRQVKEANYGGSNPSQNGQPVAGAGGPADLPGESPGGGVAGGPGQDPGLGQLFAGPVASGGPALPVEPDTHALFAAERQEPDGRGPGP